MMILSSGTVFGQETLPVQETASADAEQQAEIDGQAAETSGEPDPSVDGEWEGDGEDWQYRLTDGTCLKRAGCITAAAGIISAATDICRQVLSESDPKPTISEETGHGCRLGL